MARLPLVEWCRSEPPWPDAQQTRMYSQTDDVHTWRSVEQTDESTLTMWADSPAMAAKLTEAPSRTRTTACGIASSSAERWFTLQSQAAVLC